MSRVPQVVVDPKDAPSVVEHLYRVQRVVDGKLEFGSPQDPKDPTSTVLAAGTSHNGTIQNLLGSWVEADVVAQDVVVDCVHNLDIPVTLVGGVRQPNVRWLLFGFQHNGAGALPGSTISCNFELGDAGGVPGITPNSFPLRFYAVGRTIGADPDDLRATLFFIPAVR